MSSLEEVFNSIGEREHKEEIMKLDHASSVDSAPDVSSLERKNPKSCAVLKHLLRKRSLISSRKGDIWKFSLLAPILVVLIIMLTGGQMLGKYPAANLSDVQSIFTPEHGGTF